MVRLQKGQSILAGIPDVLPPGVEMVWTAVRLRPDTYSRVKRLAVERQTTMQEIVAKGIEALERQEFVTGFQQDFANLRNDRERWAAELAERDLLEQALGDGLDE